MRPGSSVIRDHRRRPRPPRQRKPVTRDVEVFALAGFDAAGRPLRGRRVRVLRGDAPIDLRRDERLRRHHGAIDDAERLADRPTRPSDV